MNISLKIHYVCSVDTDYFSEVSTFQRSICGLELDSDNWTQYQDGVTCKHCLKSLSKPIENFMYTTSHIHGTGEVLGIGEVVNVNRKNRTITIRDVK